MSYVYLKANQGEGIYLYTVGFFDPTGDWQPESDWPTSDQAADRVHYLNGGSKTVMIESRPLTTRKEARHI